MLDRAVDSLSQASGLSLALVSAVVTMEKPEDPKQEIDGELAAFPDGQCIACCQAFGEADQACFC